MNIEPAALTLISLALGAVNLALIILLLARSGRQSKALEEERTGFALLEKGQQRLESMVREEMAGVRREASEQGRKDRAEQNASMRTFGDGVEKRLSETLSKVADQMGLINRNLGEMSQVAVAALDLKKVMTNITSRGSWGETRLEQILEDTLTREQYIRNAQTGEGAERVEFAVLLPGDEEGHRPLQLPLDSKFPVEDYQRLVAAQEKGDAQAVAECSKALEGAIKRQAKKIHGKYINPPATADFALMFLPAEGLYLEALRLPGLLDTVRRESKVVIVGPSTVTAFLMSLRMGFTTLAVQKKSREVWELLTVVRKEFERFGERVAKVQERLDQADTALNDVGVTIRQIEKKLKRLELPEGGGNEGAGNG